MKNLLTGLLMAISATTFSQKDMQLSNHAVTIGYTSYIADDGTIAIMEEYGSGLAYKMTMHSYDADGNLTGKKDIKHNFHLKGKNFDPANKMWFGSMIGVGKATIFQTDEQGNTTETLIKDKDVSFKYISDLERMNESGHFEVYMFTGKADIIPYTCIEYNPADKTYKIQQFDQVKGVIQGEVRLIGSRGGSKYFINWNKESKTGKYLCRVISVNKSNELTEVAKFDFTPDKSIEEKFYNSFYVTPFDFAIGDNDLYFTLNFKALLNKNTKEERSTMTYRVFRIDSENKLSETSWTFPKEIVFPASAVHFPIGFVEKEDATALIVNDTQGNGMFCLTNFEGPVESTYFFKQANVLNLTPFEDEYSTLFGPGMQSGYSGSKFHITPDGTGILVNTSTDGKAKMYKEKH